MQTGWGFWVLRLSPCSREILAVPLSQETSQVSAGKEY
jgi:hypothetical protein